MRALLLTLPLLAITACSAGSGGSATGGAGGLFDSPNGPSSSAGFSSGTSTPSTATGFPSGAGGGSNNGCSSAAQLVYVFSSDNKIYSFDPPNKKFDFIAAPDCNASGSANSMAIDRNLVAWINYIGGVYTFDLKTKSGCQLAVTLPAGYEQIGMGFSTDASDGTAETLYVDGIGGGGLGKIDPATKQFSAIAGFNGDNNLSGQSAELTGTGDARLFGYFTTSPYVRVAQLDKGTAHVITDHELNGVTPPQSWAFSFWGGEFYLYAAPGSNATGHSSVIHYNFTTQQVDATYVADVGFQIVGAGVSTCAPITPPN